MNKITRKMTLAELAGLVSSHLNAANLTVTLVGGAVVTIYSDNEYQSKDLNFISPNDHRDIEAAMEELGFKANGRNFTHKDCRYTVEFPLGPIGIGNEVPVKVENEIQTKNGRVRLLSPTQCVMDRLAWYYHYSDRQCLDQAIAVACRHKINLTRIRKWTAAEGAADKFDSFVNRLKEFRSSKK